MRILDENEQNLLELTDNLSTDDNGNPTIIGLYYRMPTTKEAHGFTNGMVVRQGNKMVRNLGQVRQTYGAAILVGITEGCFGRKVDGKTVPISSNPASPHYVEDWKDRVKKQAPDCIELLAIRVFESSVSLAPPKEVDAPAVEEDAGE